MDLVNLAEPVVSFDVAVDVVMDVVVVML